MAFRPSKGRRISGGGGGVVDNKIEDHNVNNTVKINDDDDINSYSSEDFDNPYHETASTWYNRSAKRRARRQAGISSSSSSEESSDSGLESDNEDGNNNLVTKNDSNVGQPQDDKRKEMNKAIRSANRPFEKWLASYPLVASRCCLSSMPPTSTTNSMDNHAPQYNNSNTQLSLRDQETKKLRRILRRLRRKQKEFQVKFMHDNNDTNTSATEQQTDTNNSSSYYQTSNALSIEQMTKINADCAQESESDAFAINSFIPQGLGISFIDAILGKESIVTPQQQQQAKSESDKQQHTESRMVLELSGPARCGQTSILIAAAARYVASTSNIFLEMECEGSVGSSTGTHTPKKNTDPLEGQTPRSSKRRKLTRSSSSVIEPRVVILDLEKGIHAVKLILAVREAVLRRWDETAAARQWKREQAKLWKLNATGDKTSPREEEMGTTMNEQHQIEQAITSCLGRINIVQPRDFTYLSLVASIEALGHSLDKERGLLDESMSSPKKSRSVDKQQQQAPTLIMIDSLTTLDASTRHLESLPTSSTTSGNKSSGSNTGLSERNEFYRQLIRLREEHEVAIIATSRSLPSANNSGSSKRGGATLFDKIISHRVTLFKVIKGTREDKAGYDFVATLNKEDAGGVYPFSVTAGGVYCG